MKAERLARATSVTKTRHWLPRKLVRVIARVYPPQKGAPSPRTSAAGPLFCPERSSMSMAGQGHNSRPSGMIGDYERRICLSLTQEHAPRVTEVEQVKAAAV